MSRRLICITMVVAALTLTACGSSGPSLSAFKSGFTKDKAQFKALGTDLANDINNASKLTDAQVASTFGALATRATAQQTLLSKLNPPSKYKAKLDSLVAAFGPTAADLRAISTNAASHSYSAVKAAAEQLVRDSAKVKSADTALSTALGLPAS